MKTFKLEIISPEGIKYKGTAESITIETTSGQITVLPEHVALFSVLKSGELIIRSGQEISYYSVGGGFLEITSKKVQVLVDRAINADEIDENKVIEAQKRAEDILNQKPQGNIHLNAQAAFRRSLIDLKIARRRKKHRGITTGN